MGDDMLLVERTQIVGASGMVLVFTNVALNGDRRTRLLARLVSWVTVATNVVLI